MEAIIRRTSVSADRDWAASDGARAETTEACMSRIVSDRRRVWRSMAAESSCPSAVWASPVPAPQRWVGAGLAAPGQFSIPRRPELTEVPAANAATDADGAAGAAAAGAAADAIAAA